MALTRVVSQMEYEEAPQVGVSLSPVMLPGDGTTFPWMIWKWRKDTVPGCSLRRQMRVEDSVFVRAVFVRDGSVAELLQQSLERFSVVETPTNEVKRVEMRLVHCGLHGCGRSARAPTRAGEHPPHEAMRRRGTNTTQAAARTTLLQRMEPFVQQTDVGAQAARMAAASHGATVALRLLVPFAAPDRSFPARLLASPLGRVRLPRQADYKLAECSWSVRCGENHRGMPCTVCSATTQVSPAR